MRQYEVAYTVNLWGNVSERTVRVEAKSRPHAVQVAIERALQNAVIDGISGLDLNSFHVMKKLQDRTDRGPRVPAWQHILNPRF